MKRAFKFSRSMLNGHPGNIGLALRRIIVRAHNHNLIVTATSDGHHSPTSFHYTKPLARAVDLGHRQPGTAKARADLVAFQKFLIREFGEGAFLELFGPDNAFAVKNGRRITLDEGSALETLHDNHVHVVPSRVIALPKRSHKAIMALRRRRELSRARKIAGDMAAEIFRAADRHNIGHALALALVQQESGFRNVVGHDRDRHGNLIFPAKLGTVHVSEALYRNYRRAAKKTGLPQGMGPAQLTSFGYQDMADRRGGTWNVRANLDVAMEILAGHIKALGLIKGVGAYNGGRGNPNIRYANQVLLRRHHIAKRLKGGK